MNITSILFGCALFGSGFVIGTIHGMNVGFKNNEKEIDRLLSEINKLEDQLHELKMKNELEKKRDENADESFNRALRIYRGWDKGGRFAEEMENIVTTYEQHEQQKNNEGEHIMGDELLIYDEDDFVENFHDDPQGPAPNPGGIAIVTKDEFFESGYVHNQQDLDLTEDGVLLDENGDPFEYPEWIGEENIKKFLADEDEPIMYVINYDVEMDFEINKIVGGGY